MPAEISGDQDALWQCFAAVARQRRGPGCSLLAAPVLVAAEIAPNERLLGDLREMMFGLDVSQLAMLVSNAVRLGDLSHRAPAPWEMVCYLSDFDAGPDSVPPELAFLELLARDNEASSRTTLSTRPDPRGPGPVARLGDAAAGADHRRFPRNRTWT